MTKLAVLAEQLVYAEVWYPPDRVFAYCTPVYLDSETAGYLHESPDLDHLTVDRLAPVVICSHLTLESGVLAVEFADRRAVVTFQGWARLIRQRSENHEPARTGARAGL